MEYIPKPPFRIEADFGQIGIYDGNNVVIVDGIESEEKAKELLTGLIEDLADSHSG